MNKLKRILGTVAFLGIGLLLFVAVSYLLRPAEVDFYRSDMTGFYGEKDNSLDVVVFGSSAANRYLNNPVLWEETNLTSYDLTTAGQSCFLLEQFIDEVEKTQSPQLYVIETRRFIRSKNKEANSEKFGFVIDNMKYSVNRIKMINHMVDSWSERVNYYFDIIAYHDSWENFSYENLRYISNDYDNPTKGWENIPNIKKTSAPKMVSQDSKPKAIADESEEALRSLLKKCKEENIPVLFVATPYKIGKSDQRKNLYIKQIIEEAGFHFLDCNQYIDEIGLDFSVDFYNPNHVNMWGSDKVTRFIGNYIQDNYQLSTEHEEDVTEDWNQYAEQNRLEVEEFDKEKIKQLESGKEEE